MTTFQALIPSVTGRIIPKCIIAYTNGSFSIVEGCRRVEEKNKKGVMILLAVGTGDKPIGAAAMSVWAEELLVLRQDRNCGHHREAFWRRSGLYHPRGMGLPPIRLRSGQASSQ